MIDLICGDCLEVLPTLPQGCADAIIADIPYGTTACAWDSVIPFDAMWRCIRHVIKPRGAVVLFGSQPFTSALVMSNPKWFKYEWIWRKTIPSNFALANRMPMKYHENVLVFYDGQPVFNKQLQRRSPVGIERLKYNGKIINGHKRGEHFNGVNLVAGDYRHYDPLTVNPGSVLDFGSEPNCNGTKLHPTQKPVALMEYLIKTYTNEGEMVLDFTMGSGTTGVAAYKTGRGFIGIEKDAEYFAIAKHRIEQAQMQPALALTG